MNAVTTLLIAVATWSAEPAAVSGDLGRLQGTWTTSAGPDRNIPVELEIRECRVTVVVTPPVGPKIRARGEIVVNESAAPKALDWVRFTLFDGQDFPAIQAIYELEGDNLRVCNGGPNNARPTAFEPGEGMLADLLTFHHQTTDDPSHIAAK